MFVLLYVAVIAGPSACRDPLKYVSVEVIGSLLML